MASAPSLIGRERVRIGYVGAGAMAQRVHLPNFASLPNCEVVALAEVRAELGRKIQAQFGIARRYRDHHELSADPDVDAICVSAPYALQGDIAHDCLLAGKHVFMEKPMAISIAQAERILEASRTSGARLMVGYMKRYDPGNVLAHATVAAWRASGEAGEVVFVRAHGFGGDWMAGIDAPFETSDEAPPPAPTEQNLPAWLPENRAVAYVNFLQQYTHNINFLRYVLDVESRARVRYVNLAQDGYTGVVVLELDGIRATLETGNLRFHRWDEHTQVYFERGWVHTWAPPLLQRNTVAEVEIYRSDQGGAPGQLGEFGVQHTTTRVIPEPRWAWSYRLEAAHFVDHLLSGEPFASGGEDTLTDVRLFEEIYRQWLNR